MDIALSGQIALSKRLDTIAHNIANATAAGFRGETVKFESLLSTQTDRPTDFTSAGQSFVSRRQGPMVQTGNLLDVAVAGSGWLAIETPSGQAFTRDGRLQISTDGTLRTFTGYPVLDAGGAPLLIDPAAGPLSIARDGMINQGGQQVGAIGLFAIADDVRLVRLEGAGIIPDKPAEPILDFISNGVVQGYVESSNVNAVSEMTHLIEVTRAFDSLSRSINMRDETLQNAIRTLGESR